MEAAEMKMFRWWWGGTRLDTISNEHKRGHPEVVGIAGTI